MKKNLMFALAAACCAVLAPVSAQEAAPAAPAVAPASTSEHVQYMKGMIALVDEMAEVIDSVKDKASADAAAVRIPEITKKMEELSKKGEALEEPSPEVQLQLQELAGEVLGKFMGLAMKMEGIKQADFYGSEAFKALAEQKPGEQQ